ncbi:Maf1-domain-containing protein [Exidia glandulosa HHB12029]|uniref:Repressor of RNA polymerase III transcription MAF1 n=1 Tax=Exidia glandulosa HHB12029 TaxID=1314781 RepID=A0A165L7M4_EXIGL|nr:Maf1-domain-containing protein [Exidia glandulosa HHB12029]
MKYIEFPELSHLSRTLTHDSAECTVHTRIEAYSCKSIRHEKRLFKALEHSYAEDVAHSVSPPLEVESTAFGPMDKHSSRKTLYLLIATLNTCFPDHDFSDLRPDNFSREESGASVLNALSATLVQLRNRPNSVGDVAPRSYSSYPPTSGDFFPSSLPTSSSPTNGLRATNSMSGTHPALYKMIDDIIGLADCEVFSYAPDVENDPHAADSDSDLSSSQYSSGEDDEATFDLELDEKPRSGKWSPLDSDDAPGSPWDAIRRTRSKQHGALLWSSHWFFHNKKMKRVLFITVHARKKSTRSSTSAWAEAVSERFVGWDGASGAGARALAMGLKGGLSSSV